MESTEIIGKGNITMNLNKSTIPEDITLIRAILSREGYPQITDSLNLLSDSNAELTLPQVPAGTWLLIVEAMDNSGTVRYSGQIEVIVYQDNITNVYLILTEVNNLKVILKSRLMKYELIKK